MSGDHLAKASVAAQRIESRLDRRHPQPPGAFLERALEPGEGEIRLAKTEVNEHDVVG